MEDLENEIDLNLKELKNEEPHKNHFNDDAPEDGELCMSDVDQEREQLLKLPDVVVDDDGNMFYNL